MCCSIQVARKPLTVRSGSSAGGERHVLRVQVARQPLAVRCGSSAGGERDDLRSMSGPSAARSEVWLVSRWRAACAVEYEWPDGPVAVLTHYTLPPSFTVIDSPSNSGHLLRCRLLVSQSVACSSRRPSFPAEVRLGHTPESGPRSRAQSLHSMRTLLSGPIAFQM